MITKNLQLDTIANMLYAELVRQGISLIGDDNEREGLIYASAESILYEGELRDIQEAVDRIKNYIGETMRNYPNYFSTGEE